MVSTWSPFGNLVQVRQIRNFSYKSTTTTGIRTATLTSSSASGRSAFFETWEPTSQHDYSDTSIPKSLYLLVFKSRTGYPVQGSKSTVFSELLKRKSTFSLWRTQEISHTTLTCAFQETAGFLKSCIAMVTYCTVCCRGCRESSNTYMTLLMKSLCSSGTCAGPLDEEGEI